MFRLRCAALIGALLGALPAFGQSGLRPSERSEPGLESGDEAKQLTP